MQEHEEKCSFLAFRSNSQTLVDTQKLVAPQQFHADGLLYVKMMKNDKNGCFYHAYEKLTYKNDKN